MPIHDTESKINIDSVGALDSIIYNEVPTELTI